MRRIRRRVLHAAGPRLRVHPTLVPRGHVLAGVHGAFNAVLVQSDALGQSLYYGRGAGMMPTAVAVVSDILDVARDMLAGTSAIPTAPGRPAEPLPLRDIVCAHYLCVRAPHLPGVLGRVATCLGRHGVSIRRMTQETPEGGAAAAMVMLTEPVAESSLAAALAELSEPPDLPQLGPVTRIRLLESA